MKKDIIGYKLNGEIIDIFSIDGREAQAQPIYFDNSNDALEIIRHSCAHIMAQAILELYPDAKFFVGPTVQDGFYYDFRVTKPNGEKLGESDLAEIQTIMKRIVDEKADFHKTCFDKKEVAKEFESDDLKQEVLKRIPDGKVSIYSQGNFKDICRGPHVPNTKYCRFFRLTRIAGAYLGGDEQREMLTRVYGTAFADKESLVEHLRIIEEAKKRDHRKIGPEMDLFTFDEQIGGGFPLWLPAGARLRNKIEKTLFKAHRKRAYQPVRGPELLKADAWKTSGHYTNYKENMYFTCIENHEYGIKPMNCVGHLKVFQTQTRSYKDLPIKFFEWGVVHRHEKSGELHGLLRVREFTQDDSHIFCMPNQIEEIIVDILDFLDKIMQAFDFKYELEISTKPDNAIGGDEIWEIATTALKNALDGLGRDYGIDEGGGAFYGPKIDIKITDALKRKWQCGTIQVDFNLPQRFELSYIDENNEKKQPVMIHRALLGSFERFIGILIEHTEGEFPFFIAPTQVAIIPISEKHNEYAKQIEKTLNELEIDSEILSKNETLNKRIRTAEKGKIPLIIVLGDKEVEEKSVALRDRRARTQSEMKVEDFYKLLEDKLKEVSF